MATTPGEDSFAGCLLAAGDAYRTIEWLAYHYHALPLRRLIVLFRPPSTTAPRPILARWEKYIKIDVWTDEDVFPVEELDHRADEDHVRKRAFDTKCMQALKDEGARWALLTDANDYLYIHPTHQRSQNQLSKISVEEPGSVLKLLGRMGRLDGARARDRQACLPVSLLHFGGIESLPEEVERLFPASLAPALRARDFDTFRWRHYAVDGRASREGVAPDTRVLDLTVLPHEGRNKTDEHLCSRDGSESTDTVLVARRMLGTRQQYAARDDALVRRSLHWARRKNVGGSTSDEVRPWVAGFVEHVGVDEARRLLADVGRVPVASKALHPEAAHLAPCAIHFFGPLKSFKVRTLVQTR